MDSMYCLMANSIRVFTRSRVPVIMDWTEKHFDVHQHGTAVGFVMLTSHAGGVVMIYVVKIFLTPASLALCLLAIISLSGLFLTRLLPKRENTEQQKAV